MRNRERWLVRVVLLLLLVQVSGQLFSQTIRLTINVKDVPLSEVFRSITQQTQLSVVYNVSDIDPNRHITLYARNETVIRTLDMLFRDTDIVYTILGKHIVLSTKHSGHVKEKKTVAIKTRTVKGKVVDEQNQPLMGVNVLIKDTGTGVITDEAGNYFIEVPEGRNILQFSYIGYTSESKSITGQQAIDVVLKENPNLLGEIVVTAMGLEKEPRSLTYTLQSLPGTELTRAKDTNFSNSLQGKSAGLVVVSNSNGAGSATKLLLRGNKSIQGNNNPLIVIDGIPMANNSYGNGKEVVYGRGNDGGDALSTINPDDIASVSVLKGASASALYGAVAANGVIMVTTKKGNPGRIRIDVSSNTTMDLAYSLPELQSGYGAKLLASGEPQVQSWGDRMTHKVPDNVKDFFRTGCTLHNSVSVNGGSDYSQSYFSYGNVRSQGIVPTNCFTRHNLMARQSFQGFENRLSLNLSGSYINQNTVNKHYGGMLSNPLTGLYLFPRNGNFSTYRDEFETYEPHKQMYRQNWIQLEEHNQNPYWLLHRNRREEGRNRMSFNGAAKYEVTPKINIQGRLGYERDHTDYRIERYATSWKDEMGGYKNIANIYEHFYGDILVNLETSVRDFSVSATAGVSFSDVKEKETGIEADGGNTKFEWIEVEDKVTGKIYKVPNGGSAYFVNNFTQNNYYLPELVEDFSRTRLNSLFGMLQVGYKGMGYLNVTARNDWSSTLAFTKNKHMAFFYPSIGANVLLNEIFPGIKQYINLLKLRVSYSVVGNGLSAYVSSQRPVINGTSINYPSSAPFSDLKPERTHSVEGGFELSLLNNRFNLDFTFYKTNTLNQYFTVEAPWGTGYRYRNVNAGDVQNMGVELTANYFCDFAKEWTWQTEVNFAFNKNKIRELYKEIDSFLLQDGGGVQSVLKKGGSYGDIYTREILRDADNVILLDKNGAPLKTEQPTVYAGNLNSNIHLGWSNMLSYRNFSLYMLIDGKIGGKIVSATEAMFDGYGVSARTAEARDNGGVPRGDGTWIDAEKYYHAVGATAYNAGYAGMEYVYDATSFRMRELSLGYRFRNLFGPSKHLSISLIGRNLFFLYKSAPCDPDVSGSTGNGWQGLDVFSLPGQRSIGLNLKLTI